MPTGLIIVGHGTREPRGVASFARVVKGVEDRLPDMIVEAGFLELAEPSIAQAIERAIERGATELTIAPLLLFAAGHAKHDIPAAVQEALAAYPQITTRQSSALGCHKKLVALSANRHQEAIAKLDHIPAHATMLLMVGRGSSDLEAQTDMRRFAAMRSQHTPVAFTETCFLAMAEPRLDKALQAIAARLPRRVVVQPHLLFAGELLDRIEQTISDIRKQHSSIEWVVTGPLDDASVLAEVVARGQ